MHQAAPVLVTIQLVQFLIYKKHAIGSVRRDVPNKFLFVSKLVGDTEINRQRGNK